MIGWAKRVFDTNNLSTIIRVAELNQTIEIQKPFDLLIAMKNYIQK